MKNIIRLLFISLIVMLASCKSMPKDNTESIYIMIYDYENNGVKDVGIYLDGEDFGKSNVYGRFVLPVKNDSKNHKIQLMKEGYEELTDEITSVPNQIIYFKIGTGSYYANLAETKLDEGKLEEAENAINKAMEIETRKDFVYLKEVIERKKNNEVK